MNRKDVVLLNLLRKNARETLTLMSRKTNIPVSTLYDRLKANEQNIIKKHTTLLDFPKLGFNTRANIAVKIEKDERNNFVNYLRFHPNVNSMFKINNGFDYMIEIVFRHVKDMEDFLDELEEKFLLLDKQVFYIVEDIKHEEFELDPNLFLGGAVYDTVSN